MHMESIYRAVSPVKSNSGKGSDCWPKGMPRTSPKSRAPSNPFPLSYSFTSLYLVLDAKQSGIDKPTALSQKAMP
jgi:hypothetical protein